MTTKTKAIVLENYGNVKNITLKQVDIEKPRKNQVLVKQNSVGVNFFDICYIKGQYKLPSLPSILGFEASGVIEEVGPEVKDFHVGDRVAYATYTIGAFQERRIVDQDYLINVPEYISDDIAAGTLMKGLMAHTLLFRVCLAKLAKNILINAASGGVGHILTQWAKYLECNIIGGVGSDEKIDFAKRNGCTHVINYSRENITEKIIEYTNNKGVRIAFDGVGNTTFLDSLKSLSPMGMMVSFGEASSKVAPIPLDQLTYNSRFVTRPVLKQYKSNQIELALSANEVFSLIKKNVIKPRVTTYDFKEARKAFDDIQNRKLLGSAVIKF